MSNESRRPIKTRNSQWANTLAVYLKNKQITPNMISIASIGFAFVAFLSCLGALRVPYTWLEVILWLIAIIGIQGRLVCNLIDGMVAVEGGLKTPAGPVFNDLPDRIADPLIILGIGYALPAEPIAVTLGWIAALLAVLTAYIRLLGGSCSLAQSFRGPLAKQQRMAICTAVCAIAIFLPTVYNHYLFYSALIVLIAGTSLTCYLRTKDIIRALNEKALQSNCPDADLVAVDANSFTDQQNK